jgi:hypothetical protein
MFIENKLFVFDPSTRILFVYQSELFMILNGVKSDTLAVIIK